MQICSHGIFFALPRAAMKRILTTLLIILLPFIVVSDFAMSAGSGVNVKPLYRLSNFSGVIPYNSVSLAVDRTSNELLVLDSRAGDIRVFGKSGMEVYRAGPYNKLGYLEDLDVSENGSIDLLVSTAGGFSIHRCNYRGEPVSKLPVMGIPADLGNIKPNRILWRDGYLYLADMDGLKVGVFDSSGRYVRGYRIADILELEEEEAGMTSMFGFTVDGDGNLLFTIPTQFSAYRLSPDGKLEQFGEAGSSEGKFSVINGIAVDDSGYIYMTDRNRSVVIIYGPDLKFHRELGHRGFRPGNLMVPGNLTLDGSGRLYVTQMRSRGVQVYRVFPGEET